MQRATWSRVKQFGRTLGVAVSLTITPTFFGIFRSLIFVIVGDVVVHELLTLVVEQDAPFAAHPFGNEDALHAEGPNHAGRVKLDELHVLQFGASVVSERMAVAGVLPAIAGDLVRFADAAGCKHDRLRLKDDESASFARIGQRPGDSIAVLEETDDSVLHEDVDALVDAVILQGANHFEAGAIADVGQTGITMAAEVALQDSAIGRAIENRAPGFEFAHAVGSFLGVKLGHAPVVDVLAAAHGVGEVDFPVVAFIDVGKRRRDAAFGHDGVRFAEQRFADEPDRDAGRGCFDRGPQPRAAGADDEDVEFVSLIFHSFSSPRMSAAIPGGLHKRPPPIAALMVGLGIKTQ